MRRPSREKKREQKRSASSAAPAAVPVDVHVPAVGPGAGAAWIGGVSVVAAHGQEIQEAVLRHLHRIALAAGHPVHARVHDERIGYVVPLRVCVDGASQFAGEPVRVGEPWLVGEAIADPQAGNAVAPRFAGGQLSETAMAAARPEISPTLRRDRSTQILRAVPESAVAEQALGPVAVAAPDAVDEVRHEPEVRHAPSVAGAASASTGVPAPGHAAAGRPASEATPLAEPVVASEVPYAQAQGGDSSHGDLASRTRREPSTMRLSAVEPMAAAESIAPATPGRPSGEPRTMPLTRARQEPSEPTAGGVAPSTFVLRKVPEPKHGPLAQSPGAPGPSQDPPGITAEAGRADPSSAGSRHSAPALGTVSPPTGEFGPVTEATAPGPAVAPQPWPPSQAQEPAASSERGVLPAPPEPQPWPPTPGQPSDPMPAIVPPSAPAPVLAPPEESATDSYLAPEWKVEEEDPGPKPAPVREFDGVAEAVLELEGTSGGAASLFVEPLSRINEAVKLGRIQEAAEMAEQTVAQATVALGPHHPEVLKLRELTAYIAYLAGDALRSFHLSLDLAGLRHRLRDERAAYGNIQSAAAAWRAVRDPLQGLHLGRDLIAVWTDLAADAGPAADDLEQLEKARTRMTRLAERARALDSAPYAHGQ
ncbi:hypothetical protein IQ64_03565 [Streptomyces stelliscabiei]|nr:hypothetical protein IQ64_03565 [Streptomyces stelliscabiei]